MRIKIDDARSLVEKAMTAHGYTKQDAAIIADHIIDCELRGVAYGGLARVVSIVERLQRTGAPKRGVELLHETPVSARLAGHDNLGYIVARQATEIAVEKAQAVGLALVGANDTWYTGMLSYFAEIAAAEGLLSIIASNASPWVAPHGAVDGRFGTNPVCFGFPSNADPVIWDIGTSSIMHAEVMLAKRLGVPLPEGRAFNQAGDPTTDPDEAMAGAFAPWGGHKGSGLAHAVQLLGAFAGSPVMPPDLAGFGFVIIAIKPEVMMPENEFRAAVSEYADAVRSARPVKGGLPVRMPFDRSATVRREALANGTIEVADQVHTRLTEFTG
jgi:LDH2 family malate/lactate/ureidoglycolate dehydrogenase